METTGSISWKTADIHKNVSNKTNSSIFTNATFTKFGAKTIFNHEHFLQGSLQHRPYKPVLEEIQEK